MISRIFEGEGAEGVDVGRRTCCCERFSLLTVDAVAPNNEPSYRGIRVVQCGGMCAVCALEPRSHPKVVVIEVA